LHQIGDIEVKQQKNG